MIDLIRSHETGKHAVLTFVERCISWWLYKSLALWYTHWRGQHTRFHKEASFSALSFKQMVLILFAEVVWYQRSSPTAEPMCMTGSSRGKAVHIFTPALILFIGAAVSNSWTTEVLHDPATRTRYKKSLEMNETISEFHLNCCVMWFPVWPF